MEAKIGYFVTTPGDSDPQVSAVVGGREVNLASNVVGPLLSSSHDRESAGVASQAPAALSVIRAEEGESNRTALSKRPPR